MIIDSHMHANRLIGSSQNIIDNVLNCEYIRNVVNVGLNIDTSKDSVYIAKKYDKFYSKSFVKQNCILQLRRKWCIV